MTGANEKKSIRRKMKSRRQELSREKVLTKSEQIQKSLFGQPEFAKAKTISFYVAKQEDCEVETEHMIKKCLQSNKQVLVPLVSGETELSLCELRDYDEELEPGHLTCWSQSQVADEFDLLSKQIY